MSNIGIQEMIVIAIVLALLLIPVALVIGLVIFLIERGKKSSVPPPLPPGPRPPE